MVQRRRSRWGRSVRGAGCAVALALVSLSTSLVAEAAEDAGTFAETRLVVPVESGGEETLGRGWSVRGRRFVSKRGTCVDYASSTMVPAPRVRITLKTLSRVGGHFLLGIHVAVDQGLEHVEAALLNDASRRLAHRDEAAFRGFCGDYFVAAVVSGAQFVGELEVDGRQGNAAYAWLRARGLLGASDDVEGVTKVLAHFARQFAPAARRFPGGRRSDVQPTSAEVLITKAAAFPTSDGANGARPYLALLVDYPERMRTGLPTEFEVRAPEEPGAAIFAAMRPKRGNASEMLLARAERRTPPPSSRPVGAASPSAPTLRVERYPVRFHRTDFTTVYAGANEPPDHYTERVAQTSFWVPGAAAGTPRVRAAIIEAKAAMEGNFDAAPLHWVRRYSFGDRGGAAVYFSLDAPLPGIHTARGVRGFAWIPGVLSPTSHEQLLLEKVVSVTPPPASAEGSVPSAPGVSIR